MIRSPKQIRVASVALCLTALSLFGSFSASAASDEGGFWVLSENTVDPEFHASSGKDLLPELAGSTDPDSGKGATPSETPKPTPTVAAPSPTPTVAPSSPAPEPAKPAPQPEPEVTKPPLAQVKDVFTAGPGDYEISRISWNQMSAKQTCVDVSVRGTGGKVENWYLTMDADSAPFNSDFGAGNYQFPVYGYGFEGGFSGSKIKVVGNNYNQWNNFSTLTGGQERTLRICNWNTPKPPTTSEAQLTVLSEQSGEWNWSASYRVSAPDAQFYSSWKVRVDVSKVSSQYRGNGQLYSSPGSGDLKITQISPTIYEVEGVGWPTMGIRKDHSVEFRIGK